jgi:hypothetical protein
MLDNKRILLIGNGGSLKESGLGTKIDEFDEVIRINEGKTLGWEKDAGTKFTIWATFNPEKKFKKYINGYLDRGYTDEAIKDMLKEVREIWYIAPRFDLLIPWNFKNLIDDTKIIKRHLSPLFLKKILRVNPGPTTGFMLIYLLSKMYDKFYITGFDFLGRTQSNVSHHYFTDTPIEQVNEVESKIRDFDFEYSYTLDLIKNGKVEYITKDTMIDISRYVGENLKDMECICNHKSSYYWWENRICHYCEKYI